MKNKLSTTLTLLMILVVIIPEKIVSQAAVQGYQLQQIEGRNVYVDTVALANHAVRTQEALTLLRTKFQEIDRLDMSPAAKQFMRTVRFFMDWQRTTAGGLYHISRQWLINNGWKVEKHKAVNFTNINNFIDWTNANQPNAVLHELTHAYHDQVLGNNNAEVLQVYNNAMSSNKYDSVAYFNGTTTERKKAYAANDQKEFLAELTEAYYGTNDYYPFNREDVGIHDPEAYTLLRKVWQNSVYDPSAVAFDATKWYRLTTQFTGPGKSLDVINDANDDQLQLAANGNYLGQSWRIVKMNNGYYRLTNEFQGATKSLDIVNSGKLNQLRLASTGRYSGQYWRIEKLPNGYYRLTTKFQGEGKSLDVVNDANDNKLQLATTGPYTGQFWKIEEFN